MRPPTTPIVLTALLLAALPAGATAQQESDDSFLRVPVPEEGEDRIHRLRTQVRHTTVIVLPADENILDFVVGDSEYWHLTGAANVAFLKPLASDAATNIALVCESGRIYSFLVAEHSDGPPHLVVRVESGAEAARLSGSNGRPAFVARSEVAAYQQMAAEAAEAARSARQAAEAGILEARSQADSAKASPPPATSAGAGATRTNPAMRQTPARTHPSRAVFPESPSRKAASAAARVSSALTSESAGR